MYKKILNGFIDRPFFTSLYVADFALVLLIKPPFLFSFLLVGSLVAMSMYMGQKLELFNK